MSFCLFIFCLPVRDILACCCQNYILFETSGNKFIKSLFSFHTFQKVLETLLIKLADNFPAQGVYHAVIYIFAVSEGFSVTVDILLEAALPARG